MVPRPSQYCQVRIACGSCTGVVVPVAALLPCPLEHDQVASRCCFCARPPAERRGLQAQPLQHFQVASSGCIAADLHALKPIKLVSPCLENLQIPSFGSVTAPARALKKNRSQNWGPILEALRRPAHDIEFSTHSSTKDMTLWYARGNSTPVVLAAFIFGKAWEER